MNNTHGMWQRYPNGRSRGKRNDHILDAMKYVIRGIQKYLD
jgi:hypothetical protein